MSKKNGETFCIVDHANKLADRESANPNRGKQRLLRTWDKTSGQTITLEIPDWRESTGSETASVEPGAGASTCSIAMNKPNRDSTG